MQTAALNFIRMRKGESGGSRETSAESSKITTFPTSAAVGEVLFKDAICSVNMESPLTSSCNSLSNDKEDPKPGL